MKKVIVIMASAFIAAAVSCQKPSPEGEPSILKEDPVFTASITAVKTSITPASGKVAWDGDEVITITDASSVSVLYEVKSVVDGKATFVKKAGEAGTLGAGPYTAVFGADLSVPQVYGEQVKDLPMTAESATTNLSFSVSCGLLEIILTKAGESISSVAVGDGEHSYTLNCPSAQSIASRKAFYLAVPTGTYKRFAFENNAGKYCVKTANTGGEIVIDANEIQPVSFSNLTFNTALVADYAGLNAYLGDADITKILLASGTYTISSTISISKTITLEGGYSASPSAADFPDPKAQKAAIDGGKARRVMNINGSGKTVKMSGITVQNGSNAGNAGGLNVYNGCHLILDYVDIKDNAATNGLGGGFLVTGVSTVADLSNCKITGNTASGIGANYIHGGATVNIDNCVFDGNSAAGAGAVYVLNNNAISLRVRITNSEFSNNSSTGRGGAIYLRSYDQGTNGVTLHIANSTFSGNSSTSYGSAIDLYGSASLTCVAKIYSSTFTDNSASSGTYDGAITTETAGQTVNIYNSIVSGNTTAGTHANLYQKAGSITNTGSVIDGTVSDYLASDASAKDGFLTKAFKVNTAATTAGMDVATIKGYYAADDDFKTALGFDQWGNERSGTTVGACVEAE